ncbi:autotransporter domain-containing protein, partial [Fusobacterium varium]
MIEKIMKAVKSSNKRRGRNITIGAVIGFLLSCTAVMGTDNYLWIKGDGEIKFNTQKTTQADGSDSGITWSEENPYENAGNIWDTVTKTYTNNTTLLSSAANGVNNNSDDISYGLRLSGSLTGVNFVNNGSITGIMNSNTSGRGYGIHNSAEMGNIENTGVISGFGSGGNNGYGYGIYNSVEMGNIENTGVISGSNNGQYSGNGFGIVNDNSAEMGNITNTGVISGFGSGGGLSYSFGIYSVNNDDSTSNGKIGNIANTGIISSSGVGIYNNKSSSSYKMEIGNITNTGVIYGKTNAIKNNSGTIGTVDNYGILATQGSSIIDGSTGTKNNYGMYIGENGKITISDKSSDDPIEVVVGYDKDGKEIKKYMTIINAGLKDGETETVSFVLAGEIEKYDNSILNGKDETLKVSGTGNQITDSIINAYETAVVMENDSTLILNNTVVNGGAAEDGDVPTIEIVGKSNTLTLKGESIVNIGAENSVAITVGGENNVLVLEGNAKVNGEMKSTGTNNLISLNGNAGNGMNILHNISDFSNMNIDNKVTFFEEVKVTGTKKVTIAETGTLNLRLKNTGSKETVGGESIPKATHAFSDNTGMIIQGEGNGKNTAGTLNFITNGIGKKIYVDMGNVELRNLYFRTNSIIDKYEFIGTEADAEANVKGIVIGAGETLNGIYRPENTGKDSHRYEALNNIYKGLYSSTDDNLNALRVLISSNEKLGNNYDENLNDEEQLKNLLSYLGSIYTGTPYSYSSEL